MKIPVATYRLQLSRDFDFNKTRTILGYLSQLGVSHIYASPIFKTRVGSSNSYAVTDPNQVNDELGGIESFKELIDKANSYGIEWIQDIVPNHMAYTTENRMISDMMKLGTHSPYRNFFDIDWNHHIRKLKGKILAPFLQDTYKKCLDNQQIEMAYRNGFTIRHRDMEFPLEFGTYEQILRKAGCPQLLRKNDGNPQQRLQEKYASDRKAKDCIEAAIRVYNDNPELMDEILSSQVFALAYWKQAFKHINYRRFFDIIDLIGLHVEEIEVFRETHKLILDLVSEAEISGLRIDHIDGLHNPQEYLERVRKRAPNAYIIVEKILQNDENLPKHLQVEGTTGYDFLNAVNEVFIEKMSEQEFDETYRQFTGNRTEYEELVYKIKKLVIRNQLGGEMENLAHLLMKILRRKPYCDRCTFPRLREAIIELLSSFTIYRTYLTEKSVDRGDIRRFEAVLSLAEHRNKEVKTELEAIRNLLHESRHQRDALQFIMRLQQFTGVVMAIGLEDTVFYVYNRFLSLNEVGCNPKTFGCSAEHFHAFNLERHVKWPGSLNSTATHDTKRGEDVRARLNVLSEIPSEWSLQVKRWAKLNYDKKRRLHGKLVPSRNEEYYIYQTLVGGFPFETAEPTAFVERLKEHVVKAIREAKTNSSWLDQDLRYEESAKAFVGDLFEHSAQNHFPEAFVPFQRKITSYGIVNSLAQILLKITCPGIPDFYQGTELWDLNLVDPDNRRPVDFDKRKKFMREVLNLKPESARQLLNKFEDGKVKLYGICKSLKCRRMYREVFEQGEYIPLRVTGKYKNHVISFCRKRGSTFALIIVPRFLVRLNKTNNTPKTVDWKDTAVHLPHGAPRRWNEVFTERVVSPSGLRRNELYVRETFKTFPVTFLLSNSPWSETIL